MASRMTAWVVNADGVVEVGWICPVTQKMRAPWSLQRDTGQRLQIVAALWLEAGLTDG